MDGGSYRLGGAWLHHLQLLVDAVARRSPQGVRAVYVAGYAGEKLILLFPLAVYNAGPVPYVLRDLRLRFRDEPGGSPLDFQRIRSGVNPSDHPKPVDLAAAFPVPGNEVVRLFCEFERKPADRTMKVGPHPLVLEALTDKAAGWQVLLEFDLLVNEKAEENMPSAFIAHLNRL